MTSILEQMRASAAESNAAMRRAHKSTGGYGIMAGRRARSDVVQARVDRIVALARTGAPIGKRTMSAALDISVEAASHAIECARLDGLI